MAIKPQLKKLKENWLLIALLLLVLAFFTYYKSPIPLTDTVYESFAKGAIGAEPAIAVERGMYSPIPYPQPDFAPEIAQRKIAKTASISNEVERGRFWEADAEVKSIVKSTKSFVLNENTNKIGKGWRSYYMASYELKVQPGRFDEVILKLRDIGEVTSFNENALDVTGTFANMESQLEAEKSRLARYKELYNQATKVSDKIELEDRIFNQERTIKYLEEALKSLGEQVEYSTIYVSLTEEQSPYVDIGWIKFNDLLKRFVASSSSVLLLLFALLPYLILLIIIWGVVRYFRRKKG